MTRIATRLELNFSSNAERSFFASFDLRARGHRRGHAAGKHDSTKTKFGGEFDLNHLRLQNLRHSLSPPPSTDRRTAFHVTSATWERKYLSLVLWSSLGRWGDTKYIHKSSILFLCMRKFWKISNLARNYAKYNRKSFFPLIFRYGYNVMYCTQEQYTVPISSLYYDLRKIANEEWKVSARETFQTNSLMFIC